MNDSNPETTPRAVVILALSLVAFSLLHIVLLRAVSDPPPAMTTQQGVRFLFSCLLAFFLWRGAQWARWVIFAIAALAVLTAFVRFAAQPESVLTLYRIWTAVIGAFYLVVALALVIPSSITRYYE